MPNLVSFAIRRFLQAILVVWAITTIVFFMSHLSPVDPAKMILGNKINADPSQLTTLRHQFGLDLPLWQQYVQYLGDLLHGKLGYSIQSESLGQPVWEILRTGVPVSTELGLYALILALIIGLPVGLISAVKQNSL